MVPARALTIDTAYKHRLNGVAYHKIRSRIGTSIYACDKDFFGKMKHRGRKIFEAMAIWQTKDFIMSKSLLHKETSAFKFLNAF